ncbi:CRISPR-associated endonuclease Cas3'', partial [Methanosphaera sp. WGK6]|uniref:CRISPR-associated endonuclease Cas3'' n=1 Tax=Methanosphaera sp. WGK6 TaxID=1561964 RepID=UPI00084BF2EF
MSYYTSTLYSHPDKKLTEHLLNVADNSKNIFETLCIENNSFYADISFLIGLAHDFAKCTSFFQRHLFDNYQSEKTYHSFLSAIFGYYIIKDYVNRKCINDVYSPILGYICIIRHHGDLKNIHDKSMTSEYHNIKEIPPYIFEQINDIKSNDLVEFKDF